jgi:NDP-sugar pyrophosphorylase family protein
MPSSTTTRVSTVPVVILAGGQGTRLRPLTFAVPKPLLWAGREPILGVMLRRLRQQGFRQLYLALGYHADLILAYIAQRSHRGLRIETYREGTPLGTAGPLRAIVDRFGLSGPIIVTNGDILTRVRFDRLLRHHVKSGADLTVGLLRHQYRLPLGEVTCRGGGSSGRKPLLTFDVSGGMYVVEGEVATLIPVGGATTCRQLVAAAVRRRRGCWVTLWPSGGWRWRSSLTWNRRIASFGRLGEHRPHHPTFFGDGSVVGGGALRVRAGPCTVATNAGSADRSDETQTPGPPQRAWRFASMRRDVS